MAWTEEKEISRETARHLRIFLGTRASCSTSGLVLQENHSLAYSIVLYFCSISNYLINQQCVELHKKKKEKIHLQTYKSSVPCQRTLPLSASRKFIQFLSCQLRIYQKISWNQDFCSCVYTQHNHSHIIKKCWCCSVHIGLGEKS